MISKNRAEAFRPFFLCCIWVTGVIPPPVGSKIEDHLAESDTCCGMDRCPEIGLLRGDNLHIVFLLDAHVAELADALDSGSSE